MSVFQARMIAETIVVEADGNTSDLIRKIVAALLVASQRSEKN